MKASAIRHRMCWLSFLFKIGVLAQGMDAKAPPLPEFCEIAGNPVPLGVRPGWFTTSDGVRLRSAVFKPKGGGTRGTICLVHGRTEFIEKYFETISDFLARGFAVATFDWRGQGGSQRLTPSKLGHVKSFEDYWCDLKSFHADVLLPDCPGPFYLVGHSMGGLVSLLAAERDRLMFDRVFLSAPMIAIDHMPFSTRGMARFGRTLTLLGLGHASASRKDVPQSLMPFADNPLTGDALRFTRNGDILRARPDLETLAPTYGWAAAAFTAMAEAAGDAFPTEIKIPVLMLVAARDRVVSSPAIEALGLRMRTGRHIVVPGAQHELFQESDPIRAQVMAAFDAFVTNPSA
jgi:lysophospholipase